MTSTPNPIEAVEARIRANRDDADAWRVYADWLLDHGDPRGELILLELQPGAIRDPVLRQRITVLKRTNQTSWQPAPFPRVDLEWLHGFVVGATVEVTVSHWLFSIGPLLAHQQARLLGRLKLVLEQRPSNSFFEPLASLDFGELCWLEASRFGKGDRLVRALVRQSRLGMHRLDLEHGGLTDAGLIELVGCTQLRGLRRLSLSGNAFGLEGIRALANAPSLSDLEELDLRYTGIDVDGATALASSPFLRRITALRLDVDEDGAAALSPSFSPTSPFSWQARAPRA